MVSELVYSKSELKFSTSTLLPVDNQLVITKRSQAKGAEVLLKKPRQLSISAPSKHK